MDVLDILLTHGIDPKDVLDVLLTAVLWGPHISSLCFIDYYIWYRVLAETSSSV